MNISSEQIRAARACLNIPQTQLARLAHISIVTVRRIEAADRDNLVQPSAKAIRKALEDAGIEFIPSGIKHIKKERRKQEDCFAKLMALSKETGRLCREGRPFSEKDLYDENGLPA